MRLLRRISFQKKLLIMVLIPLTLLGIVIGTLSYQRARGVVQDAQKRVLSDSVNRVDISINLKVRQINGFLQVMAQSNEIQELIQWREQPQNALDATVDISRLEQFVANTWDAFTEIRDVSVITGSTLAYTTALDDDLTVDETMLRTLYADAKRHPNKINWSNRTQSPFLARSNDPAILIYRGLTSAQGDVIGLIVLEADPVVLGNAILTKQKILEYQTTFLIDRDNQVIYSDNSIDASLLDRMLTSYRGGRRKATLVQENNNHYFGAQYNGLTGYVTVTWIPESALFPAAVPLRNYIAALVAFSVLLTTALLLVLSWAMTSPLARLTKRMKEFHEGNLQLQIANDREDEIGELTDSFNYMIKRINVLVNEVYYERLAQKTAELEALQAQINPHFLYNTLDSINWMLIDRGQVDISAIVVALGKLMHYSMDTHTSMATLAEEFQNIGDYLKIQKNRFEDQLEFTLTLDPAIETFPVPKLILQPLVENAIIHSWPGQDRIKRVVVSATRIDDLVYVRVQDNGQGMTAEALERYRHLLINDPTSNGNIGVRNVARRLQLHFNGRCAFEVDSEKAKGTTLTMIFPQYRRQEDSV